jgi:hypothetical protein
MQENKPMNIRLSDNDFKQFMEIYKLLKESEHIAGISKNKCVTFLIKRAIPEVKKELEKIKKVKEKL